MRSREKIEKASRKLDEIAIEGNSKETLVAGNSMLTVELLLDIRDLLSTLLERIKE